MSTMSEDLPHRHRITVDEYYRMAQRGSFAPEARMELIDGEIIDVAPIGSLHMAVVDRLQEVLTLTFTGRAIVRIQGAVRLGDLSMPQPDVVLLKRRDDFYSRTFATAADALLVVEASDTTLRYDLDRKVSLYARHAVAEAWVIDVQSKRVHTFRAPQAGVYTETSVIESPGSVVISQLSDATVDLSWLKGL